jgi:ABC-type uncharacterized transport system involved in gliding motility auxiliary subunit
MEVGMKRRILQETNWGVFLLLALVLFLFVNYLAFRHYHRWDLTQSRTFSLSPQTEKVLKGLTKPLDVVVFLAPGDELYGKVKDLLNAYQGASPRVHVEAIDPDRQRARMQELAKRYNVTTANTVVFALGDASKYVEKDQMVDYDFSTFAQGGTPKIKAFKAEEAFTNAILDLLEPKKPVIYFTAGHGERQAGGQGEGIGTFKDRLSKEGDQVRAWESLGKPAVPPDADLVVVAGPEHPFMPQEAAVLDAFLKGGGKALFLLDPVLSQGKPPAFGTTGLEGLLKEWGLGVDQDLAVDPKGAVPYLGAQTFFAAAYSQHAVVRDLAKNKLPVLFTLACSLQPQAPSDSDFKVERLVESTAEAWGEKDLVHLDKVTRDASDVPGPLVLAAAVSSEKAGKKARIVAVGDCDLLSDSLLQAGGGNLLFGLNAVHWLLAQESRLAIPPKTEVETHLSLTAAQSNFLFALFVVFLPGIVIAAGVFTYMKRRR